MEENTKKPLKCMFCGKNDISIVPKGGFGRVYIATCNFCGARGRSHTSEKEALSEWWSIVLELAEGKRLQARHMKIRCPECGEWMDRDDDDYAYRCYNVMCDLSSDY